jgi:hypothetical protein
MVEKVEFPPLIPMFAPLDPPAPTVIAYVPPGVTGNAVPVLNPPAPPAPEFVKLF